MRTEVCAVPVKCVDNSHRPCLRDVGHTGGHNPFSSMPSREDAKRVDLAEPAPPPRASNFVPSFTELSQETPVKKELDLYGEGKNDRAIRSPLGGAPRRTGH